MTPGIYYLYEYKENKKIRNVGFFKLTRHYQSCILQLSVRQVPVKNQDKAILSVFFFQDQKILEKPLSYIPCQNHIISARLIISETDFPQKRTLNEVDGFLLKLSGGQIYAAAAPNTVFSVNMLTEWEDIHSQPENTETYPQQPEEFPQTEEPEPQSELEVNLITESETDTVPAEQEVVSSSCQEEDTPTPQARKIQRSEISSLPKRFWSLANNSFLLHGYHNYNHLLLVEEDGEYWLGVPGIYDSREARAAELFGFPQFTREYTPVLNLSQEECNNEEDFGHWCRWLK